jgi:CDP-diacylglycerol--glycerol-3-phosphate 3-phosphatidyltransferase
VLVVLATAGSYLVSYVRARAQSLGFNCDGGLLARPERVLITVVGLLLTPIHPGGLLAVVAILAVFTNFTAVQRVWSVWRQSRQIVEAERPTSSELVRPKAEDIEVRPGPEPAGG